MASMVAKACNTTTATAAAAQLSQVMTVSGKGSRNKRKFRADPPVADANKTIPENQYECASYEFCVDKFGTIPNSNGCDMCSVKHGKPEGLKLDLGLSCAVGPSKVEPSRPREDVEGFRDADWNDLTESQLEELVLSNLDVFYKSAIKKIEACGYSEEVAHKAVLRSGFCYGCKDIVSNIVDNALAFLNSGQGIDASREHYFEDLQQMEKYVLAELVYVLQEVRPFFSTGDAMWCLLISDMNLSQACALDSDPSSSVVGDRASNENSLTSLQPQFKAEAITESNSSISRKPTASAFCAYCPSDAPTAGTVPHEKPHFSATVPEKECSNSLFNKPFSAVGTSHPIAVEKFVASKRVSGTAKRDYILRQKSIHLEKHYRTYSSKGSRTGKLNNNFGGFLLDKKLKAVADSTGLNLKNTTPNIIKTKADQFEYMGNQNALTSTGFSSTPIFGSESSNATFALPKSTVPFVFPSVNTTPSLSVTDTENSLPVPVKCIPVQMPISHSDEVPNCGNTAKNQITQWATQDKKEEMIMKLIPRVRELQNQLQEWNEWANQKVMQAARRLSKDKAELKTLRLEKEEIERLKKEKQTLEENTMKKLTEMATALGKASGQVDRANAAVRRLGVENTALRREMEAAKLHAAESAVSCREVSKREKKTLEKFHSLEKQKTVLQDELATEKSKLAQLKQKLELAKELENQTEAKWKQEEKAKEELISQASSLRKEREQINASFKSKEDAIKMKAESNLQKYKEDIENLEKEISQLRLKADSSKIAALKRGIDGSKPTDLKAPPEPKESNVHPISKLIADFRDYCNTGGVKREHECVMCLSEEMSVVFLPCAHQVVCTTCNELHKNQGMKDCPSCRSPIQQRICVRFAHS